MSRVPPNARYLPAAQAAFTAQGAPWQVRFWNVLQFVKAAGGGAGAASWCLFFLCKLGRIEAVPHEPPQTTPPQKPDPRAYVLIDTAPASWEDVRQLGAQARVGRRAEAEAMNDPLDFFPTENHPIEGQVSHAPCA